MSSTVPSVPRYSIVVPAFNEEQLLAATLASLSSQSCGSDFEIIVVDNNSTDATAEVARASGVRVVFEPQPGVCQARQRGLEEAAGEIVISVDADTDYPSGWLARIDKSFDQNPGSVAVAGPCRYQNPPWWIWLFSRALFGLVAVLYRLTGWTGYVTATNTAFRRDCFAGYDLNLTQGGDELDLLRHLRSRGRVVWDAGNVVHTSARRQRRGLLHTLFVSFLLYYVVAYAVNRLARRPVLGLAPVVREIAPPTGAERAPRSLPSVQIRNQRSGNAIGAEVHTSARLRFNAHSGSGRR